MTRRIAKILVGKREKGEVGYYRKLKYVQDKLREFILGIVLAIIVSLVVVLMVAKEVSTPDGKYVPDGYDIHGNLIDTDGDGDYYHWVEE